MFDGGCAEYWEPPDTRASRSLLRDIAAAQRQENQACARRLRVAAELFETRRTERGEAEDWAVDTWAAVAAEIAAALRISLGKASSILNYGHAMRRLPQVAGSPKRRTTRTRERARRIATERNHNRQRRSRAEPAPGEDPPPF